MEPPTLSSYSPSDEVKEEITSLRQRHKGALSDVLTLSECKRILKQILTVNLVDNIVVFRKDRRNWLRAVQVHPISTGSEIASLLFDSYFADDDIERSEMLKIWEKLIAKAQDTEANSRNTALLLRQLGILNASIGNYDIAINHFKRSSEIGKMLKDNIILADNYFEVGLILRNQGKYNQAWDSFINSEKHAGSINHYKTIVYSQGQRANLLAIQSDFEGAINLLRDSLQIWEKFERVEDKNMRHTTLHTLGRIYMQSGRMKDAKDTLLESLRLKELVGERYDATLRTRASLAEISISLGDFSEAKNYITEESVETSFRIGSYLYAADALKTLSQIYFWEENYVQANRLAKRSLDISQIANIPLSELDTLLWIIQLYLKQKNYLGVISVFPPLAKAFFSLRLTNKQAFALIMQRRVLSKAGFKKR